MLSFFIIITFSICSAIKYDNYTLYRAIPDSSGHLDFLNSLRDRDEINFWTEPGIQRTPVEFVIAPNYKETFLRQVKLNGLYLTTINENVQSIFDQQTVKPYIRRKMESYDWLSYHRADDIYAWMRDLESFHPGEVKVENIGRTSEGREILAATVILRKSLKRSKVIMEGGIHAREWIAPAVVTYFMHMIVNSQNSNNKLLKRIGLTYEFYFVPLLNPDGYEYSHETDRLWRKNRNKEGVDLNRNFGIKFGQVGVSFKPKSDTYCGPKEFSENESIAMRRYIHAKGNSLEYYFAMHSFGQHMVIPYAFSKSHHENYEEMKKMCEKAAKEIKAYDGKKYTIGTAFDTVGYTVSGASVCWTKRTYSVPYALNVELRDEGYYGFALPPEQIKPTCKETTAGMLSLLKPQNNSFSRLKFESVTDYMDSGARDKVAMATVFNCLCIIFLQR